MSTEKDMGARLSAEDETASDATTNRKDEEAASAEPSIDDDIDAILGEILARVDGKASEEAAEGNGVAEPAITPATSEETVAIAPAETVLTVPAETIAVSGTAREESRAIASLDNLPSVLDVDPIPVADEPTETPEVSQAEQEPSGAPEPVATITASDGPKHAAFVEPRKKRSKLGLILALLLLALLGGGYVGGVWAFGQYFLPNTTLNGEDVSLQPVEEVAARHSASTSGYEVTVTGQGIDLTLTATDVDLRSDGNAYVQEALSQLDPLKWPLEILESHALTADKSITFDEAKVTKAVTDAVEEFNKTATKPKDATYAYDDKEHQYKVVPEEAGTALMAEDVVKLVVAAVDELSPSVELGEDLLVQPAVLSDDAELNKGVTEVNAKLAATQKLVVGDNDVFDVGSDLIAKWTKVSDKLEVTVDQEAITTWARGELSDQLDTAGRTHSYTRPDGKNVTVTGGEYGWTIDGGELAKTICDNINAGTSATIDIPMLQTAASWNPGGQEWGKRYIDIDLSEQHVRMYDDGGNLIWESDCVTGNTSEGHDTPQGVWQINSNKESGNVRLEGPEDKKTGEPEYVSYVTYWMPFVWNAVAMHDATWRYSFGGTIYQTDGSHGCVNLPYDKAEALYGLTEVGDVVITHY